MSKTEATVNTILEAQKNPPPQPPNPTVPNDFTIFVVRLHPHPTISTNASTTDTPLTNADDSNSDSGSEAPTDLGSQAAIVDTWTVFLINPAKTHTYTISGGITPTDGPYTRVHIVDDPSPAVFDGERVIEWVPCGKILDRDMPQFEALFNETQEGPNQFFVCRWFAGAADRKIGVREDVVRLLTGMAAYADVEMQREGGDYTAVDKEHLGRFGGEGK